MADEPPDRGAGPLRRTPSKVLSNYLGVDPEALAQALKALEGGRFSISQIPEEARQAETKSPLSVADDEPGKVAGGGKTPRKRGNRGTTKLDRIPGRRPMKEYPLTGYEMLALGGVQGGSAVLFALAGALFGFWLNVGQSIAFAATETDKGVVAYWEGLRDAALVGSIVCVALALGLFILSGCVALKIKRDTDHGE